MSEAAPGLSERLRRLFVVPAVRQLLVVLVLVGVFVLPFPDLLMLLLRHRSVHTGGRRTIALVDAAVAVIAFVGAGRISRVDDAEDADPAARHAAAGALTVGVLATIAGLIPAAAAAIGFGLATTAAAALSVRMTFGLLTATAPRAARVPAYALGVACVVVAGGLGGALFISSFDHRFGVTPAAVLLLIPAALAARLLQVVARIATRDAQRVIDDEDEAADIRTRRAAGENLPMLACRGIDFSYGQLQVLFGVDFKVDDGEMVALLGVNGAGKSTLLKVISGIGLPSAGTVRFRGTDITYLDAERRLGLGVTQIPGGRAVFGPMTVVENLRTFGYTLGRDKKRLDAAVDHCFEAFPRLAERRNQNAGNLSGGEQQMLGLSKALILEPKLLLIDELSLGLAPIIVGQLLDMVRQINASGTAVVLVEQSVNIALNLVHHAYFMEKGEIRFDGRSSDLLNRDDLLRAVFLEGVGRDSAKAAR